VSCFIVEQRLDDAGLFIRLTNKQEFFWSPDDIKTLYSGKTQAEGDAAIAEAIETALGSEVYDKASSFVTADPVTGKVLESGTVALASTKDAVGK